MDSLWNVGKVKTIKMKRNPEILRVLLFLAIGLLFLFLLYKVATRPLHVIQENKYIDLKNIQK